MQVVPGVVRLAVNVATDDDRCEHGLDIVLLDDNLLLTVGIGWDVFTNIYPETSIYARVKQSTPQRKAVVLQRVDSSTSRCKLHLRRKDAVRNRSLCTDLSVAAVMPNVRTKQNAWARSTHA